MILLAGLSLPMLLSGFSHMETWHLACNMIVLWSFSPVIHGTVSGFFYVSSIISIDLKTKTFLGWQLLVSDILKNKVSAQGRLR